MSCKSSGASVGGETGQGKRAEVCYGASSYLEVKATLTAAFRDVLRLNLSVFPQQPEEL